MTDKTTNTNTNATLASRAAGLLSKTAALAVAEKAIGQAVAAKRVFPPMATDFAQQLGYELPLKTRDFVKVVGHLLASTEKPIKGIISKRKAEIVGVLAELVGALTDTTPVSLPEWALPKERAKKVEASEASDQDASGALAKANTLAEAEANAAKAEASADKRLADAVALIVTRASELTEAQRDTLLSVLASTEVTTM